MAAPESRAFDAGGYYTLRRRESWAMIRCHTYRDRPAHCDQLHVDLWWRGLSILQDCGTYRYYVPGRPDVEYYFKSCRAHNNVEIDGQNPLELASRFMWFPWPRARRRRFETMPNAPLVFEGEKIPVYDKPFRLVQDVTLDRSVKPGETIAVTATLHYQACTEKICYIPATAPLRWTVTVSK